MILSVCACACVLMKDRALVLLKCYLFSGSEIKPSTDNQPRDFFFSLYYRSFFFLSFFNGMRLLKFVCVYTRVLLYAYMAVCAYIHLCVNINKPYQIIKTIILLTIII